MAFTSSHFELHVRDLPAARRFYVDQLGLAVLQETAAISLLAVRAGDVRLSIFGDRKDGGGAGPSQIILATDDLQAAVAELEGRGLKADGPSREAPGFLRYVVLHDPEGNAVAVSEYLRDPLKAI